MIPKTIHQTWKSQHTPAEFDAMRASWREHNPGWEVRLWTDADLDALVAAHYPAFLDIFRAYPNPVQRADAGRYLVLHRFGGVYADLDATCDGSFDALCGESRIIFSCEPDEHAVNHIPQRALPRLICNAVMASPAGHPFWLSVLAAMGRCRHAGDVLESTGPLLLTGCVEGWRGEPGIAVNSCHLFNPLTRIGAMSAGAVHGPHAHLRLARHHWAGSWFTVREYGFSRRAKGSLRKALHWLTRGAHLDPPREQARLRGPLLAAASSRLPPHGKANIAILVPIRDAAQHIPVCLSLIGALDYPKDRLKLVFCEGDSSDGTAPLLATALEPLKGQYRDVRLLHCSAGMNYHGKPRWKPSLQRRRRSAIAKVRNHLIDHGLDEGDDWALWIDADVIAYPTDVLERLMAAGEAITVPDCVLDPGGRSFDQNSFLDVGGVSDATYYKMMRKGLFQPPANFYGRRHLHDLRYLDKAPLTGVGGTMLLIKAALHRAGLRFPEIPYRDLIETEALGKIAGDCGVTPHGLPNLEIRHFKG